MEKQSMMSGGKVLALAGSAVAVVLVLLGLAFSGRLAPPEPPQEQATQPVPQDVAQTSPAEAGAKEEVAESAPQLEADSAQVPTEEATAPDRSGTEDTAQSTDAAEAIPPAPEEAVAVPEQDPAGDSETAAAPARMESPAPADTDAAATADSASVQTEVTTAPTSPAPPSFDTVRLAPDGEALVAGRGLPGRTVEILLDGVVVGTAMTAGDGAFVAFLSLPPSDAPRVLTLATDGNGEVIASDQQVIIAPVQRAQAEEATPAQNDATVAETDSAATQEAPATAAPALLLADDSGVRVLQPATPADPAQVSGVALDVISYTSDGDVLLQGRAAADQSVLIYLDNAAVTSAKVGADGIWSTGLPGVTPGIYTLRLDEVDATGKVLSRIETPFKREDRNEVAAIAAATAPAAGSSVDSPTTAPSASGEEGATATEEPPVTSETASAVVQAPAVRVVTVQPGNTLWAIARESYGSGPLFVRVFEANRDRIRDPDLIYPGQIFEIPE